MSFRVCCPNCHCKIIPPFWNQYEKAFCGPSCASQWRIDCEVVTVKEVAKDFEVMTNNTFIHPDEKIILRSFSHKMKEFIDPIDVETIENKEFKKAIEVIDRISL